LHWATERNTATAVKNTVKSFLSERPDRKGVEQAIELSIHTGIPLIIEKEGKIEELKPKYKYVRVQIT